MEEGIPVSYTKNDFKDGQNNVIFGVFIKEEPFAYYDESGNTPMLHHEITIKSENMELDEIDDEISVNVDLKILPKPPDRAQQSFDDSGKSCKKNGRTISSKCSRQGSLPRNKYKSPVLSRKTCIVPSCDVTALKFPNKRFISVPKNEVRRKAWIRVVRTIAKYSKLSTLYVCEDHFNLQEDADNWVDMKIFPKQNVILKRAVVPHIFKCQPKTSNGHPPRIQDTGRPNSASSAKSLLMQALLRSPKKTVTSSSISTTAPSSEQSSTLTKHIPVTSQQRVTVQTLRQPGSSDNRVRLQGSNNSNGSPPALVPYRSSLPSYFSTSCVPPPLVTCPPLPPLSSLPPLVPFRSSKYR